MDSTKATQIRQSTVAALLAREPANIQVFGLEVVIEEGHYRLVADDMVTGGTVSLAGSDTIVIQPRQNQRPFLCRLLIRAPFLFASEPVRWTDPGQRPEWVGKPTIDATGTVLEMLMVDAVGHTQAATFELVAHKVEIPLIDPTIVSNPPR